MIFWTAALILFSAALAIELNASASRAEPVYPVHSDVTATVFWIGEPVGDGSTEDNSISAWDDSWLQHYGGVDDPSYRRRAADGYFPRGFTPRENPFYIDLPFNDFDNSGVPILHRSTTVPWAKQEGARLALFARIRRPFSLLKNRWVKLQRGGASCFAQWEDAGPYAYDDAEYVFSTVDRRPRNQRAQNAGMDVSPAVRDCLHFRGLNNAENTVAWQFVEARDVPAGPWRKVVTHRQVSWR